VESRKEYEEELQFWALLDFPSYSLLKLLKGNRSSALIKISCLLSPNGKSFILFLYFRTMHYSRSGFVAVDWMMMKRC
jgi:hypothetical protein